MARSVERGRDRAAIRALVVAGAATVVVVLAGCTTTQHEAQRLQLDAARLRSAIAGTRVKTQAAAGVRPSSIRTVTAGDSVAFVVTVRNRGTKAVTDLPISVGYTSARGARVYLNAGTDLEYFQAHLPAIQAGGSLNWVYTATRRIPAGAQPFALIGDRSSAPARVTERVRIGLNYGYADGSRSVTVHLDNPTSVPQYQLQLYAYASGASGYVAAGNATIEDLGAGAKQKVKLPLIGTAAGGKLTVRAIPTILQ